MKTLDCDVVIVGAGVAGLFLACNLRHTGLKVVVVELNKKIPDVNRGDQLAPCTVKMLDEFGALKNFEKRGSVKLKKWQALGPEGDTVNFVDFDVMAPPPHNYILGLPHAQIHESLLETATESDTVEVIRGFRATDLLLDDNGTACGIRGLKNKDEYQINARLVAGCDGPRSKIRELAGIKTDMEHWAYDAAMLTCLRSSRQPADLMLEIWGAQGYGGMFPIEETMVRCPVQIRPGEITRWREIGKEKVHAELAEKFPYYADMELLDKDLHSYKIYIHHAEAYTRDGVVILGDAAHCTPPFYGMGMNMGMRDAYYVSGLVTNLLNNNETPTAAALQPYEESCYNFNQFVINASHAYGSVAGAMHPTMDDVRTALRKNPAALNVNVMGIIFADYRNPPPEHTDPKMYLT